MKVIIFLFVAVIPILGFCQSDSIFYFPPEQIERRSSMPNMVFTSSKEQCKWETKYYARLNAFYSRNLKLFKEPVLYNTKVAGDIYRFQWDRAFHGPVVISLEKNETSCLMHVKAAGKNRSVDDNDDDVILDTTFVVSDEDWECIYSWFDKLDVWQSADKNILPAPVDGSVWILECRIREKYDFMIKNSPEETDNLRQFCEKILEISGLKIEEDEIY